VAAAAAGYMQICTSPQVPCKHPTTHFLQVGCHSCHPTSSIKALKTTTFTGKKVLKPVYYMLHVRECSNVPVGLELAKTDVRIVGIYAELF